MDMTVEQRRKYADWLRTFDKLTAEEAGYLVDIIRGMLPVLSGELEPRDGVTSIGSGTVESLTLLQCLCEAFMFRERVALGPAVAGIRMRIVDEGDAAAMIAIARASRERGVQAAAEAAEQAQTAGDLVVDPSTPESVVEALRQQRAAAEAVPESDAGPIG